MNNNQLLAFLTILLSIISISHSVCNLCCMFGCNATSTTCTQCCENSYLNGTTDCKCLGGYFQNSTLTCLSCKNLIPNCVGCSDQDTCTACQGGYFLNTATDKCLTCGPLCRSCRSVSDCDSCVENAYRFKVSPTVNECHCAQGYVQSGETCSVEATTILIIVGIYLVVALGIVLLLLSIFRYKGISLKLKAKQGQLLNQQND